MKKHYWFVVQIFRNSVWENMNFEYTLDSASYMIDCYKNKGYTQQFRTIKRIRPAYSFES